ncbi:unnamed protein product [Vitrella brassicaformis CCMP3155]|uniref:Transcriptional adapter n=3 Tax=Vitrella brassicaformis TaxID=1169539 RepID=A0A0G4GLH2_VITBC|nr:unnamed protein product [Vitrella brassicaformis CCMP3155]|eukprot:CEM30964.1 unnamed protein product [Vitrella brassicaformis CCMP3155]
MMDTADPNADEPRAKRSRQGEDHRSSDGSLCGAGDVKLLKYHCDYCHCSFTSSVRIKCAECRNMDLCVECFARGVERGDHKSNHKYYVLEPLSHTRILSQDWSADEDWALLEGIEKFGLGNWQEIADHINTIIQTSRLASGKDAKQCEAHYTAKYLKPKSAPIPDADASARARNGTQPADQARADEDLAMNDAESVVSRGEKRKRDDRDSVDQDGKSDRGRGDATSKVGGRSQSGGQAGTGGGAGAGTGSQRPQGGATNESNIIGFMPKRGDFDVEYDNDAELIIADMEFTDDMNPEQRETQLKVLEVYNAKLDERQRRKNFFIERGLLDIKKLQQEEKKKPKEERELYNQLRPLMRFHDQASHNRFVSNLMEERRLRSRLERLREWKSLGLASLDEAHSFEQEKKRRDETLKDLPYIYGESQAARQARRNQAAKRPADDGQAPLQLPNPSELERLPCANLLTQKEREFCESISMPAQHYLVIKKVLIDEAKKSGPISRDEASKIIRLNVNKTARLYDFLMECNWIAPNTQAVEYAERETAQRAMRDLSATYEHVTFKPAPYQAPLLPREQVMPGPPAPARHSPSPSPSPSGPSPSNGEDEGEEEGEDVMDDDNGGGDDADADAPGDDDIDEGDELMRSEPADDDVMPNGYPPSNGREAEGDGEGEGEAPPVHNGVVNGVSDAGPMDGGKEDGDDEMMDDGEVHEGDDAPPDPDDLPEEGPLAEDGNAASPDD